jgi:DNA-binding phage protein
MTTSAFWDDLQRRLQDDPEFAQLYLLEWVRISTVDRIVNELESRRESMGISKAALARSVQRDPAAIRRLLSDTAGNPTVETVSSVAAAMGYRLELVEMDAKEREAVTVPLRELADR